MKIAAHVLIFAVAVLGAANLCVAEDAALPVSVPASDANIRYMGRWDFKDKSAPRCNWAGCAVQAKFQGTAIGAKITFNGNDHFQVVIDGKATDVVKPEKGTATVTLAKGLSNGDHTVELFKRTETYVGKPQFLGFQLEAGKKLLPLPPRPKRSIEMVGDSITCGYGNDATNVNQHFTPETENNYMAYGAIAAREVGAEYSCIAYSGRKMSPDNTMPEIYDRIIADDAGSKWDFTQNAPSVVLINLGTNDFRGNGPEEKTWTDAYKAFVGKVRKLYPEAHIYLAIGSMMSDGYPPGKKQLSTIRAWHQQMVKDLTDAGDKKVHFIEFAPQDINADGGGADWHPSVKTHQKMAAKLVEALKKDLGW